MSSLKCVEIYMSWTPDFTLAYVTFLHDFVAAASISELTFKYVKAVSLKFIIHDNKTLQERDMNMCE